MPEISRFYGIVIRMFYREHAPPHFHAEAAGQRAVFSIEPVQLTRGSLPGRAERFVVEWARMRQSELLDDWRRAQERQALLPVPPLE